MTGEERVARLRRPRFSRIDPADDRARCCVTFGWRMLNTDALVELQSVGQVGRMGITVPQGRQTPTCLDQIEYWVVGQYQERD
jgi:hypothetical protein